MYKIALDAMGFENDISEVVNAAKEFIKLHPDCEITLVGDKNQLQPLLNNYKNISVLHTDEFMSQDDTIFALRQKRNSSIQLAADLLKENKVDGVLSACSTPLFVFVLYSTIGTIKNINNIGFMPTIPKVDGFFNMIDVGATLDISSDDLINFAIMANEYAKQFKSNPVIKLLNIGTEEHKGPKLVIETNEKIKNIKNLNYQGFIEPNILLCSDVDVVLCDAFTGNIALKALEGTAKTLGRELKKEFKKPKNFFSALLAKGILKKVAKKFDYKNHAGAFVLGLNKLAVKTHGSADKQQFLSALEVLYSSIKNDVLNKIKGALEEQHV